MTLSRLGLSCVGAISAQLVLASASCLANWSIEPVDARGDAGWSLFIDVDSTGNPHAAYYTTNPNGDFRSALRPSATWQAGPILKSASAFALDRNDDRFFVNVVAPDFHPHFNILLDNGLVLSQKLASTRISSDVFLDFDSQNRPQIGYVDTTARQLKHAFWNGASWTTRTVASGPEFQYGNSGFSATLDNNDQLHFAWSSFDTGLVKYAKPNGTSWQVQSPFPTLDASVYDLAVDGSGNVHLAYDVSTGNVFTGGLFYAHYDGIAWDGERIPGLDAFGPGRTKIVLDHEGQPHLFTYDSTFSGPKRLKHLSLESGSWSSETIDSYTGGSSGPENIEVLLDDFGYHVLYSTGHKNINYAHLAKGGASGDFNDDGVVDAADYTVWRDGLGSTYTAQNYQTWNDQFGGTGGGGSGPLLAGLEGVPEPTSVWLALFVGLIVGSLPRWTRIRK